MDVIDFIMHIQKTDKHQVILKAQPLITNPTTDAAAVLSREPLLTNLFTYFKNVVYNNTLARDYVGSRALDHYMIDVGVEAIY